jgi:D-amino-acid dehydrogenase
MNKNIIIIGGGIVGLCSAYFLQKQGHEVTIIDQSNLDAGASYVNAGYLSPSHIIPLSAPGVMAKGIKWMFNSSSPLYIKPRLDKAFLNWAWAFNKSCNQNHVDKSAPIIRDIAVLSQELYQDISTTEKFSSHYQKKGLLMLCQTEKTLAEELKMAELAISLGLEAKELSVTDLKQIEPNIEINAIGATYYQCDHHSTPNEFMVALKNHLKINGVQFYTNEIVKDLEIKNNAIHSVITNKQTLHADQFVLAAGSWSTLLSKKIGLNLLLQAGKGYRIDTLQPTQITVPAILAEAKTAVTPMNGFTRFAGTMEIAGVNNKINKNRVEAIANAAKRYYPDISLTQNEKDSAACGLRPVSPDGMPYIGKSQKCNNLVIATGHAMMGWSMAPATGQLVSQIIANEKTSLDIQAFQPDRRF